MFLYGFDMSSILSLQLEGFPSAFLTRLTPFRVITVCFLLVVQDVSFQLLLLFATCYLHYANVDFNPLKL